MGDEPSNSGNAAAGQSGKAGEEPRVDRAMLDSEAAMLRDMKAAMQSAQNAMRGAIQAMQPVDKAMAAADAAMTEGREEGGANPYHHDAAAFDIVIEEETAEPS